MVTDASVAMLSFRLEEISLTIMSTESTGRELGLTVWARAFNSWLSIFKMSDDDVSMKKVKELMAKKDAIEKEIKEFQEVLDSVSHWNEQVNVSVL